MPSSRRYSTGLPKLQRRGCLYYCRIRIPKPLLEVYRRPADHHRYPGKLRTELVIALGTSDLERAKLEADGHAFIARTEFSAKRDEIEAAELRSLGVERVNVDVGRARLARAERRRAAKEVTAVTPAIAERLKLSVIRTRLDRDRDSRLHPDEWEDPDDTPERRAQQQALLAEVIRTGNTEPFHEATVTNARLFGYIVKPDATDFKALAYAFVEGMALADKLIKKRDDGEVVDVEAVAPLARTAIREPRTSGTTLDSLVDSWVAAAEVKPRPKSIASYRADVALFGTFLAARGKDWVEEIGSDDWFDFVADVEARFSARTAWRKIGAVRTVFISAELRRLLPKGNPCCKVATRWKGRKREKRKARYPFSREQIQDIFNSPLFTTGWRPRARGGEAYFFLPLLACFSGCRVEELGQLRVEDIQERTGRGWFLNITDEYPGQHLKNESARRRVPIHRELVLCGFLDYVDKQRQRGVGWLFEELKPDKHGIRTSSFSKVINRYLRNTVKIAERNRPFHAFRHAFKDALREAKVPLGEDDAITGHTTPGVGSGYGAGKYPIDVLFDAMDRVSYPGVNVAHLWRTPLPKATKKRARGR